MFNWIGIAELMLIVFLSFFLFFVFFPSSGVMEKTLENS